MPACFIQLTGIVADTVKRAEPKPDFCNTRGDGLFVVFSDVRHAAEFALGPLETVGTVRWDTLGRSHDIKLRVGLHAGPVYPRDDAVLGRQNYFGRHVNLAARIEPKTAPGCVYTSEQFAALLAVAPNQHRCVRRCESTAHGAGPAGHRRNLANRVTRLVSNVLCGHGEILPTECVQYRCLLVLAMIEGLVDFTRRQRWTNR